MINSFRVLAQAASQKASLALRAFVAAAIVLLFAAHAQATTLEELDQILTQAPDLNAFLNNPNLIDRYYAASADYYGGGAAKFPRKSYDAIIAQMRTVSANFPAFAQRSWETNLGTAFTVKSNAASYARDLNQTEWDSYLKNLKFDLTAQAGPLATMERDAAFADINAGLARVQDLISKNEADMSAPDLKKSDRAQMNGAFFQALKTNPDLQRISSYLVLKNFQSAHGQEVMDSGNPDLILNYLKEIKDQPKLVLQMFTPIEKPELLASSLKQKLPDPTALMKETAMFPQKMITGKDGKQTSVDAGSAGKWNFKPSPRRFHAFFKGMYFGECVGGSAQDDFLPGLTPERWATVILNQTQFHFIERDGKFQGWVQAIPLTQGSDTYASVDFASHSFRQSILQKRADGRVFSEPMLAGWLREAMKVKPASWKGFIVGQSNAINNGGALPTVRSMPGYILGEKFDPDKRPFAHADPVTVKTMTSIIPLKGYGVNYGGSMIFDASVKDAKTLTALKVTDRSLYDVFREAIKAKNDDLVNQTLQLIHSGAMSDIGNEILTLRGAGVLRMLAEKGYRLPNKVVYWTIDPAKYFDTLKNAGLTLEEMKQAQVMIAHTVPDTMAWTKALVASNLVKDGESYVSAIAYEVNKPTEEYKDALTEFIKTNVVGLAKRFPDTKIADLQRLELLTKSIPAGTAVLREGVPLIKTIQETIDLFSGAYARGNEAYKKALNPQLFACVNWFFKKSPTIDDAVAFAKLGTETWSNEQITMFLTNLEGSNLKDSVLEIARRMPPSAASAQMLAYHANINHTLATTSEEKQALVALHDQAMPNLNLETGWKESYLNRTRHAQSAAELAAALVKYPTATGAFRTAIAEVAREQIPRLLQMNPTYDQLMSLLKSGINFQASVVNISQVALEKSSNVSEYAAVFDRNPSDTPGHKAERLKLLKDSQSKLVGFSDLPQNLMRIRGLEVTIPGSQTVLDETVLKNLQAALRSAKSVEEIQELFTLAKTAYKGSATTNGLIEFMRQDQARFTSLNPTKAEQSWYNSSFLKLHERVIGVFRAKPVRCELAVVQ